MHQNQLQQGALFVKSDLGLNQAKLDGSLLLNCLIFDQHATLRNLPQVPLASMDTCNTPSL